MLVLSSGLISKEVLSLRATAPVASVEGVLINPKNLKIEGFYCKEYYSNQTVILLTQDIREIIDNGYIVNDREVLSDPEDLIRLKEIINLKFGLINKRVETVSKEKIGKVNDYVVDLDSMYIQKLHVNKPIYKHLNNNSLIIDRSQINEITPSRIIINDLLNPGLAEAGALI